MMDAKYLAEIKAREQAATKGPWEYGDVAGEIWSADGNTVIGGTEGEGISISKPDATFITAAREDIPALIAEVERLQNEVWKKELAFGQLTHYNAAKDQQIATLKNALELACEAIAEIDGFEEPEQSSLVKKIYFDGYIKQAQEVDRA